MNQQHKNIEVKEILIDRQCCHFVTIASGKCDQNAPAQALFYASFLDRTHSPQHHAIGSGRMQSAKIIPVAT